MTDRYFALTVSLDENIRGDDAESIINAIRMIKGVLAVEPLVANPETWAAYQRAKSELAEKLWEALNLTSTTDRLIKLLKEK